MRFLIINIYSLAIFGGGFLLGWYFATLREHRRHMARMKKLHDDLKAIDIDRKHLELKARLWESHPRN